MAIEIQKGCWRREGAMMGMVGDWADLQAQFSLAYVQAVASVAGYFVDVPGRGWDKDGLDVSLMRRGKRGVVASPRIDLQVKSHHGQAADPIVYDLSAKSHRELCDSRYQVPRLLVLVLVPRDVTGWLAHSEKELRLRRCGYWLSLRGAAPTENTATVRVNIPRRQVFDAAGLAALMDEVAAGGAP